MHVVATAGHVDHGKSTLVRALTGMEPDRWAEEQRRGMTIDLGFAWTGLESGATVAFVDVPGHERFVPTMLAGVGPVPAVLFVVAADEGWMPQSAEHLDALDALGVHHGLVAVTRSDLADPGGARDRAVAEFARTSVGTVEAVCVSATTGSGLTELRRALDRLVATLPEPDPDAPVRLWVDRAFSIRGAGTVVTGTLAAGTLRGGDELVLPSGRRIAVRGMQSLGRPQRSVSAVARVAVNLRGVRPDDVPRGSALLSGARWLTTDTVDIRLSGANSAELPRQLTVHIGTAGITASVRPLGADTARLTLGKAVPLRVGDRAVLRDPGAHRVPAGATVLDVRPPPLRRRGAAAARSTLLSTMDGEPDGAGELRRRGIVRATELVAMGVTPPCGPVVGDWLVDPPRWTELGSRLSAVVADYARDHPLEQGIPTEVARRLLDLPDPRLVGALVRPPLAIRGGRVADTAAAPGLPPKVIAALSAVRAELERTPFRAPEATNLDALGLDHRGLAAAVRAGALVKVAHGIYLLPGWDAEAVDRLAALPQPFTVSQARQAMDTSRRVAVPVLELLARLGRTRRLPDGRHQIAD